MTLQEEITALLHGDLIDEDRVGELMHILAVSPEKRGILVEQIRLSRAFTQLGSSIATPHAADERIWQGIDAIDNEIAGRPQMIANPTTVPTPAPVAATAIGRWAGAVGSILLLAYVVGVQLLGPAGTSNAGTGTGMRPTAATPSRATAPGMPQMSGSMALLDSLNIANRKLSLLSSEYRTALTRIKALEERGERIRVVYRNRNVDAERRTIPTPQTPAMGRDSATNVMAAHGNTPAIASADSASNEASVARATTAQPTLDAVATRSVSLAAPTNGSHADQPLAAEPLSASASTPLASEVESGIGPWQIGVRDHFRLSLPRVYGLNGSHSIMFDRDIYVSYRVNGSESGLLSSFKVAATGGQTQFAQAYHTNTGGQPVDTVILQAPTLNYARLMLAPDVIRTANVTGSLELSGGLAASGLAAIGPIATFGINVEYRPIERVAIHGGASSWLLWTQFASQTYVSTNMNAHLGFAIGF